MPIHRKGLLVVFAILSTLISTAISPGVAGAQQSNGCAVSYRDLNGDGQPDLAVIKCPFAGHQNDTVYVYDRAGNMRATGDWRTLADFEDDLWVFDAGGDGTANLIIDFHRDGNRLIADLYDDQDEDGNVDYRVVGGRLTMAESDYPTVRVVAPDGWWLQGSKINYNLDIEVDGPVRASFNSPVVWLRRWRPELLPSMLDDQADVIIHVRDVDYDGRPDYEIRQVYPPPPFPANSYGTELMVNTKDNEALSTQSIFWPYLGTPTDYIKPYGESVPPIQIDWEASKIVAVTEFVASRGNDSNWFIYSSARFGDGDRTYANFENPFAFYDLAADQDGYPELMIRMEHYGAHDPAFLLGRFDQPIQTIRLSWDQDNDQSLDYKVGLIGRHEITKVVTFPDFAVRTVPYTEYPDWVLGRKWDAAAFVVAENIPYHSSEGIYEGAPRAWRDSYVTGLANDPSLEQVQDIRQGLRHEYTPELQQQPWLYFSPVDRKLHLRHAWGGVWNVDGVHRVRYTDLDDDGYLDQWLFTTRSQEPEVPEEEQGEEPTEELIKSLQVVDGFLVYGDANRVKVIRSEVAPSLFETLPPRNHQEWLALGEKLDQHRRDFAADDFLGMMNQFQGPTTEIEGATLEDFRLTDEGFRFVLNLLPHFRVLSDANELGVADLSAGSYLVTYGSAFQVQPLTPPHITLPAGELSLDAPRPREKAWTTISATLHNSGLRDVRTMAVRIYAARESGEPQLLAEKQASVPGEGEYTLVHEWWPPEAGRWTIWLEADTEDAIPTLVELGPMACLEVEVEPAAIPDMFRPLAPYDGIRFTWPVALLLGSAGLAALSVLGIILRQDTNALVVEPIGGDDRVRTAGSRRLPQSLFVLLVALYAVLAAGYFVLRYAGRWAGSDTALLSMAIAAVTREGKLWPARGGYSLGFAYPVVSTFITAVTGLSVTQLQFLVYPIVAACLSLVAFVTYRQLTGDAVAGALATLFLFLQPDFLFVIFRGSHEKVTWLSAMLAIFLLARSFGAVGQLPRFATYVGLFYLAVYALIASNCFFGSSFVIAVGVSLVAGFVALRILKRRTGKMAPLTVPRLVWVTASATVLWFLSVFYLYTPAMRILYDLKSMLDRLIAVTLGHETAFSSYAVLSWAWVSQVAYLGLMLPSYIAGGTSFIIWVLTGRRLLRGDGQLVDPPQFLLWLLYGGFGIQLAISIVLTRAGGAAGYLQLRLFVGMMLVVFPLVAGTIVRLWRIQTKGLTNRSLALTLSLMIVWASWASLLKVTNDPWLSNYWTVWTVPEDQALQWVDTHLRYRTVWLGLHGIRVSAHAVAEGFGDETGNDRDTWVVDLETRDLLLSRLEEAISVRTSVPLHNVRGEHRVYDNGIVAHYHLRPRTPYQR